MNVFDAAAPQPIIVVEVRIADETLGATPMTGSTIVLKGHAARGRCKAIKLQILPNRAERRCLQLVTIVGLRQLRRGQFLGDELALAIVEQALAVAGAGWPSW